MPPELQSFDLPNATCKAKSLQRIFPSLEAKCRFSIFLGGRGKRGGEKSKRWVLQGEQSPLLAHWESCKTSRTERTLWVETQKHCKGAQQPPISPQPIPTGTAAKGMPHPMPSFPAPPSFPPPPRVFQNTPGTEAAPFNAYDSPSSSIDKGRLKIYGEIMISEMQLLAFLA